MALLWLSLQRSTKEGEIVLYQTEDGKTRLDVRLEKETIWLSLDQMAGLFERDKSVISRHLNNVFKSGELLRNSVVAKNATTAADGKTYMVDYFSLDAIISIGYRVIVKNYSFVDGNKRIAASLFLWFLDANGILYRQDGGKRIGDNTLVALTLMIAESRPEEKEVMTKVIVNLINKKN